LTVEEAFGLFFFCYWDNHNAAATVKWQKQPIRIYASRTTIERAGLTRGDGSERSAAKTRVRACQRFSRR
jgi:hypothetical protein